MTVDSRDNYRVTSQHQPSVQNKSGAIIVNNSRPASGAVQTQSRHQSAKQRVASQGNQSFK